MALSIKPSNYPLGFLSFNTDVLGIIAEHLTLRDIYSLIKTSKKIGPMLEASVPMTQRRIIYKKSVEMLPIIRLLVPKAALGETKLDTDPAERPYGQHIRLLHVLDSSINYDPSKRFTGISADELGEALSETAFNGHKEIVKSLVTCARFEEISADDLGDALSGSAFNCHIGIFNFFVTCARFGEIPADRLGEILENSALNGYTEIVKSLIDSPRFGEIPIDKLEAALLEAVFNCHIDIFNFFITCARFGEIPSNSLKQCLEIAVFNGHTGIIKSLVNCTHFTKISIGRLEKALGKAVVRGDKEIQDLLTTAIRLRMKKRSFTE